VALSSTRGFAIPIDLDETFARLITTLDHGLRAGLT
jgi:hypothetical protein